MQPMRNSIFPIILIALAVLGFSLPAAELAVTDQLNEEPSTLIPQEGNALAIATDIRVSDTDPTDLVSYIAEQIAALREELAPTPPAAFIGWSEDATFTAAEFQAGTSVTGDTRGEIPDAGDAVSGSFAHLGLWLAGDAWDGIASVRLGSGGFGLSLFAGAEALSIDGVAGKYRRTVARQGHALLSGETLLWE